ncbi:MAG: 2-amino-4-hydroxy-6-hydroxymethyldihydropteridine diphosphokinase [Bdellovibrionales bacterium]
MILIGLGANLPGRFGTPEAALAAAYDALAVRGVVVVRCSPVYISAPVPVSDQPWYRNAAAQVETDLPPVDLLDVLKAIEADFGRVESARNAARVLDLDILAYDDVVMDASMGAGGVQIPHSRLHERAFVLYPLRDIAPDWRHPVSGLSIDAMIAALPPGQEIEALGQGGAK